MTDIYIYKADLVRVVDGDTIDLMIDPGFYLTYAARVRLHGIDCPERRSGSEFEKQRGQDATQATEYWFEEVMRRGADVIVRTYQADSFGRWLVDVTASDVPHAGPTLAQRLKALDLAVDWPKRWREVYDEQEDEE